MHAVTAACVLQTSVCELPAMALPCPFIFICLLGSGGPLHSDTKVECVTQCRLFRDFWAYCSINSTASRAKLMIEAADSTYPPAALSQAHGSVLHRGLTAGLVPPYTHS